jgi:hypothetical protein
MLVSLSLLLAGCASTFETPPVFEHANLRESASTVLTDDFRVSAAVPSREQSKAIFGVDLSRKHIQPLWLEIQNKTDRRFWFLPTGLDPEYFSPLEVAFAFHTKFAGKTNVRLDEHIESLAIPARIDAQTTVTGFVYTNEDQDSKFVSVDLVGEKEAKNLSMTVRLPERLMEEDHFDEIVARLAAAATVQVDNESDLRQHLERLPCCTTSADGKQAEPLNLVVIGDIENIGPAFIRREYRYVEVSPRYLFGRPQDTAARKRVMWTPAQPHIARFWVSPIRFRDMPVWVGQVAMPVGGRFAPAARAEAVSLIDPDVDEARNDLVQDLAYSQSLRKMGFVKGVGKVMAREPRKTPDGSTYHTDGLRAVFLFDGENVPLSQIGNFDWERLLDHYREQVDTAESQ